VTLFQRSMLHLVSVLGCLQGGFGRACLRLPPLSFVGSLVDGPACLIPMAARALPRFGNTTSPRPPLLLLHGFASSITSWGIKLLQELGKSQEVVIFDARGQGLTKVGGAGPDCLGSPWPLLL
jgi:pimeloyl-ACP methyl ester carboxylesterase